MNAQAPINPLDTIVIASLNGCRVCVLFEAQFLQLKYLKGWLSQRVC